MWPITLSGRLSIVALVSRYLTNKLMDRGLISKRDYRSSPFNNISMRSRCIMRY